ncbi:hypothetical protein DL766_006732 [Monosporascus sp. MC13-8B]|nr:hypothetical protein DL763_000007 [Monosporascus cannonballus]RYP26383.1 hypothetical protein DL766_006732 [Monosporascus sp. MC13-8B]
MAEEENDGPPFERPSFKRFWKRVKQTASGDNLKFIPSGPQQQQQETQRSAVLGGGSKDDGEDGGDNRTATAKAQARRAQVRKAQVQHRQRKANYTKQLEMDAVRLRDEIARAEGERAALRGENDAIRRRLAMAGVTVPPALQQSQPQSATTTVGLPADAPGKASSPADLISGSASTMSASPSSVQYIVNLDMSEMNSPAYQVYRTPTPSASGGGGPAGTSNDPGPAATGDDGFDLTDAQTDYAINFILALEHVCWDHFHPSYFSYANYDEAADESTHMLMASALALRSAPASVFDQMTEVREHLQANPSRAVYPPSSSSHPHSQAQTQHQHQHKHHQQEQQKQPPPPPPIPSPISWQQPPGPAAAGLSLGSLRRLAEALNPPDVELAPVQAWFEIARACGPAAVRDAALMDFLKRELARVVRCVHFGAAIPRHAFNDVVGRVTGVGADHGLRHHEAVEPREQRLVAHQTANAEPARRRGNGVQAAHRETHERDGEHGDERLDPRAQRRHAPRPRAAEARKSTAPNNAPPAPSESSCAARPVATSAPPAFPAPADRSRSGDQNDAASPAACSARPSPSTTSSFSWNEGSTSECSVPKTGTALAIVMWILRSSAVFLCLRPDCIVFCV